MIIFAISIIIEILSPSSLEKRSIIKDSKNFD